MSDQHPPPLQFTQSPAPVAILSAHGESFTLAGSNGRVLAIVDLKTGRVTLRGDPNEAARLFWRAIEATHPVCDK